MTDVVLKINNLSLGYRVGGHETLEVVHDVSLDLRAARVVGLAGESGSGKSTLAKAAMGWRAGNATVTGGSVEFRGQDLLTKRSSELRKLWGKYLSYVPQDVASALNPSRRVGSQLDEALRLHTALRGAERRNRISGVLDRVSVPSDENSLSRYPFEFSGGQQQRIAIALAMLCDPAALVLDEPTTGIDAALRVEVFGALRELLAGRETAVLYISHDLAEIASIADDLGVMYAGQLVEYGPAKEVFDSPLHPYSSALRAAVPDIDDNSMVTGIAGKPPTGAIRGRCAFAERCDFAIGACVEGRIEMTTVSSTRRVRCIRATNPTRREDGWRRGRVLAETALTGPGVLAAQEITAVYRLPQGGERIGVKGITISLQEGETLGVVGESGSGKSTMLRCLAGIHPIQSGRLWFGGSPLPSRGQDRGLAEHRAIQLVFQNPDRSLNPRHSVGRILSAPLRLYEPELSDDARSKAGRAATRHRSIARSSGPSLPSPIERWRETARRIGSRLCGIPKSPALR